jgi:hypothetical protein
MIQAVRRNRKSVQNEFGAKANFHGFTGRRLGAATRFRERKGDFEVCKEMERTLFATVNSRGNSKSRQPNSPTAGYYGYTPQTCAENGKLAGAEGSNANRANQRPALQ